MKYVKTRWILLAVTMGGLATNVRAGQGPNAPPGGAPSRTKTRTELLNELNLRTAQVDLEHARQSYERLRREHENANKLFERNILSKKELDEILSAYIQSQQQLKQAEIALEKTKLSFLANATHITILEAKKYYDNAGRRMLDLVIKNMSNLAQAESALMHTDPNVEAGSMWQSPEQIRALLNIENIIVSIVNEASSIGKPYEEIIPLLPYNEQKKVTFELLTDVEQAGVRLQYLGQITTENIHLEKESLQEIPTVIASQFSQEGQLGADLQFPLDLEMLVTAEHSFALTLTNMPPQINCYFIDPANNARVTSVRFDENVSKHSLALRASIPQKLDLAMIDKTINFQVWIVTSPQLELLNAWRGEHGVASIPREKLDEIKAARVDLALIPKGSARLEILIDNLYMEIKPEQPVDVRAELRNSGTLELFDLRPEILPPMGWKAEITPASVPRLAPDQRQILQIHLEPRPETGVGEYEAEIMANGHSGSSLVEAVEKRLKVRVNARTSLMTTFSLVGGLVGLVAGVMIFGVRLSRR